VGVTTNHADTFMTIFDLKTGRRKADLPIATPQIGSRKTQGHTSKWFGDSGLLYTAAAQNGLVLAIDPAAKKIVEELPVAGSYLIQRCFV